jgi:DDE family transposase
MLAGCIDRVTAAVGAQPLINSRGVKRGDHKTPTGEHGDWRFAGADYQRKATKWRCLTGECKPASTWVKAERLFPLIPRETPRWTALYRRRAAVEREFGRLKKDWALAPLRVRGLDRVRLHADLTILATLARARAVPLAA